MDKDYVKYEADKRPHHHPTPETREEVGDFVCAGYNHEQIAEYFNIDHETLKKHYKEELCNAKMRLINLVSKTAYQKALEGNEKMIDFVLRTQAKWVTPKAPEDVEKDKQTNTLLGRLVDKINL